MNERTDIRIIIYPCNFVCRGYKKIETFLTESDNGISSQTLSARHGGQTVNVHNQSVWSGYLVNSPECWDWTVYL